MRLLHEHSHCYLDERKRVVIEVVRVFSDSFGNRELDIYTQRLFPIPLGTSGSVVGAIGELGTMTTPSGDSRNP
jgi:hypothetical protein